MIKWTNFVNESNKISFDKKMLLTLTNGLVLEAKLTIKDLNESFADAQLNEKILNQSIKSFSLIKEEYEENIEDSTLTDTTTQEFEYYVPYSSIFDEIHYDSRKISQTLLNDENVISVFEDNEYGWSNQPEVVIAKIVCEESALPHVLKNITTKLEHAFGTQWIKLTKKDW